MKRSIRFGMLLVVAIVALIAADSRATAQVPIANVCCTYSVDIAGVPAACFPIVLRTRWTPCISNVTINANGIFVFPIGCVPCPPIPAQFFWASLAGCGNLAWFNFPTVCGANGCCFALRIGRDAAGCIVVTIRPVNPPC